MIAKIFGGHNIDKRLFQWIKSIEFTWILSVLFLRYAHSFCRGARGFNFLLNLQHFAIVLLQVLLHHAAHGHVHNSLREVAAHVECVKVDGPAVFALLPEHHASEHVDSNDILLDWIGCILIRMHEKGKLALMLALQHLGSELHQRFALRHERHLETRVHFRRIPFFICLEDFLLENMLFLLIKFMKVLEHLHDRRKLNSFIKNFRSTNNIAIFVYLALPGGEFDVAFVVHFLKPSRALIVYVFVVKIPEELFAHVNSLRLILISINDDFTLLNI